MRIFVVCIGIISILTFLLGVGLMAYGLWSGMAGERSVSLPVALCWDAFLLLQFPLLHSYFLNAGSQYLGKCMPREIARPMQCTVYSWFASLQLVLVFSTWQSSGIVLYEPSTVVFIVCNVLFVGSWLLLKVSMLEAGVHVQTGIIGWWSVLRRTPLRFPAFPQRGLHGRSRHPIYLTFALIIVTAPSFTLDRIALAVIWTLYCIIGPVWKERRIMSRDRAAYSVYKQRVPYFLPRLRLSASTPLASAETQAHHVQDTP